MNYKMKIFIGATYDHVDDVFNAWVDRNHDIEIIDFKYQIIDRSNVLYCSICILYKMQ